jgi:phospholipid/cholesterol/gamma-HCH transport system substrate-binding protein
MKKTTGNKIKLGMFVSTAILLLIAGIYFIGSKQQLFSNTFTVNCVFHDISGLKSGNNVRFSGINVGIVEDIEQLTDSTVMVSMRIKEHSRKFMKTDARAVIGSDGLMGNKIVIIVPGEGGGKVLADNDVIGTTQPVNIDDIMGKLKVTSDNVASITGDLASVMKNIREGKGAIGKLLMDSTTGENVEDAVVNIKKGAGGFKKNMDAASHNVLLRGFLRKKIKGKEKDNDREQKPKEEK